MLAEKEDVRVARAARHSQGRSRGTDAMALLVAKKDAHVVQDEDGTENLWQPLRRGFQDILEKGKSEQVFDNLYRNAYTMVLQEHGALLHDRLREAVTDHLVNKVRPAVLASADDNFLQTVNQAWNDHQSRMRQIRGIVLYLEQLYVPDNKVCSVQDLGPLLFREEVARHEDVRVKLQESLLQTMNRDREGVMVDKMSVKSACEMLVKLGVNSRSVYEEDFERLFVAESAKFYALESEKHLPEKSTIEYVDMVEQRMNDESQRARLCLDPGTERLIQQVVYQELVANHVKTIVEKVGSGIVAMLENERVADLARTFRLLSRAEDGLKAVAQCVSKHLRALGRSLVTDGGDKADSLCLVKELIDLKDRYEHLLSSSFKDERFVKQIISSDFEYVLSLTRKSPEHVALFADETLRAGIRGMEKQEIEQLLDKIVLFARLLHEKDLFEHFYKQHLCKRLLLNKSASEQAERIMVSKLKVECGPVFTSKFEAMLKDMSLSKTMAEEFATAMASCKLELHGLDLGVRVLTTGFWPFPAAKHQCKIPAAPLGAFETFRRFYLSKHTGRQLNLQPQLGWADVAGVFYPPDESSASSANCPRTYVILVSTYQMCVLMLFNGRDRITYQDIASETGIPETDLVRALQSLTVGRDDQQVLVKDPPINCLEPHHVFAVNESFTTDLQKVKIETATYRKAGDSKENGSAVRNLDKDRRFVIEAAIVRIMKLEQRLSHSELVTKLTDLLTVRFPPCLEAIDKAIEVLIDREYLERAPENAEVYTYVP